MNNKKRIKASRAGINNIKPSSNSTKIYTQGDNSGWNKPMRRSMPRTGPIANRLTNKENRRSGIGSYIRDRVKLPPSNHRSTARNLKERLATIGRPGTRRNITRDGIVTPNYKRKRNIVKGVRSRSRRRR